MIRLLFLISSVAYSFGRDIWVSPDGSDKTKCSANSETSPLFSLNSALECVDGNNDTIFMGGGEYEYRDPVLISESITIIAADSTNVPNILLVNNRPQFITVGGPESGEGINVVIINITVDGFNVVGENIPSSGFIINDKSSAYANVEISGVIFRDFTRYDYEVFPSHTIDGLYQNLIVSGCQFISTSQYNIPNTHIHAAVVGVMTISSNYFGQLTHASFILDPVQKKATGGSVILTENVFMKSNQQTIGIYSPFMSWTIKNSLFSGNVGPTCSFAKANIGPTSGPTLVIDSVKFDSCNCTSIYVSDGCSAVINNSVISNSVAYALVKCTRQAYLSAHSNKEPPTKLTKMSFH
jgi:hypothetical protein